MKEPIVTIITPTYQRLDYLRHALESALRQTYRDFELIVSDDSASDEIAGYVATLRDDRVRYRRNARNLGIAMNHYAAFAEARGKYIACLHDDDMWQPEFLAELLPVLEADSEVSVAFSDHFVIDEEGNVLPQRTERTTRFFKRHLLKPGRHQPFVRPVVVDLTLPMVMASVFRKSILAGAEYPKRIGGSFDHWLAYLAVKDGQAVYYVPRRLTCYRVHKASGTLMRGVRNFRDIIYVRRRFLAAKALLPYDANIRNGLGMAYGKMADYYLANGSFKRGRIFLKTAFSLLNRPRNILSLAVNTVLVLGKIKSP
jgi:glycosyltransferase involved in cell wall biosynthesis